MQKESSFFGYTPLPHRAQFDNIIIHMDVLLDYSIWVVGMYNLICPHYLELDGGMAKVVYRILRTSIATSSPLESIENDKKTTKYHDLKTVVQYQGDGEEKPTPARRRCLLHLPEGEKNISKFLHPFKASCV